MAIKLYSWPRSTGARVQWALEELGLPYEYVELDRTKGEHKSESFLSINPNAKVPAIVDNGVAYFESLAILLYLAERYGVDKKLWPAAGQTRADALSWTVWAIVELQYNLRERIYHGLDSPISYKKEDRSAAAAEFNLGAINKHLTMIDKRLAGRDYLMGEFTLADVAAASTLRFGTMFGISLDGHPAVAAWADRCGKRPAWAKI